MDPHSHTHDLRQPARRLVRSWKTPIEKAAIRKIGEEDAATSALDANTYDYLLSLADSWAPGLAGAIAAALKRWRDKATIANLISAVETGDVTEAIRLVSAELGDPTSLAQAVENPLLTITGDAGAEAVPNTIVPAVTEAEGRIAGGQVRMRFDMTNPLAIRAAKDNSYSLIRQVSDDSIAGIRQIVSDAMAFGGHPYEQARKIRALIGLTETQAEAVGNFREMLENGDTTALTRLRRDRRFDPTLERALGDDPTAELTSDQIDTMVQRYAERTLADRAETISRTETMRAANLGVRLAWQQAVADGWLDAGTKRRWLATPDDRTCPFCIAAEVMNAGGVGIDEPFETPFGPMMDATLHPNCRCVSVIIPASMSDEGQG